MTSPTQPGGDGPESAARTMRATFQPKRMDNLKPDAMEHVGETCEWERLWAITNADGGDYVGQHAWHPLDPDRTRQWFGWVPTEDLQPTPEPTS